MTGTLAESRSHHKAEFWYKVSYMYQPRATKITVQETQPANFLSHNLEPIKREKRLEIFSAANFTPPHFRAHLLDHDQVGALAPHVLLIMTRRVQGPLPT